MMEDFAAIVMQDERLAERLAAIDNPAAFVGEAVRSALAHDIALSSASVRQAREPDPVGLSRWTAPAFAGSALPPKTWLPVVVAAERNSVCIDWARFGAEPLRESFYEDSIRRALSLPFNRAFRYRTSLADLIEGTRLTDSCAPDGFIFHMSRCGSTLVAQMLAALDDAIVISEAAPIDAVVQLSRRLPEDEAVRALRAMVAVFGRRRRGRERRYFLKLDFWHALALPLFRQAFPNVPWVFLYRDPVEVLVSQMRQRGMQMVPEYMPPAVYGIETPDRTMSEDYCAQVLAAVCRAAIDRQSGGGLLVDYRRLPGAVIDAVLPHFRTPCSKADVAAMQEAARHNAKSPDLPFAADSDDKQRAATAAIRSAAERHLGALHRRLDAIAARPRPQHDVASG